MKDALWRMMVLWTLGHRDLVSPDAQPQRSQRPAPKVLPLTLAPSAQPQCSQRPDMHMGKRCMHMQQAMQCSVVLTVDPAIRTYYHLCNSWGMNIDKRLCNAACKLQLGITLLSVSCISFWSAHHWDITLDSSSGLHDRMNSIRLHTLISWTHVLNV